VSASCSVLQCVAVSCMSVDCSVCVCVAVRCSVIISMLWCVSVYAVRCSVL